MEIINNIEITNMTISDLDSIKDILLEEFDDFWNENISNPITTKNITTWTTANAQITEEYKSELENNNSKYIVAKFNDEIVGFAGIWVVIDEAHITNIVTKKSYRNNGIGNLLLENLIKMCKNYTTNISSLTLEVSENNVIAQNLYKKFNFEILGERKKYYNDESAIIMTLYFW